MSIILITKIIINVVVDVVILIVIIINIIDIVNVLVIKQRSQNMLSGLFWFGSKCEIMSTCKLLIELLT